MVRFENQNVQTLTGLCDGARDAPQIIEQPRAGAGAATRDDEPNRLVRVVRRRRRLDRHSRKIERHARLEREDRVRLNARARAVPGVA